MLHKITSLNTPESPLYCEECGGDAVLDEEAFDEIIQGHGQFGVGS